MRNRLHYTAEMVRALPDDGKRYEVVDGQLLVSPAPRMWHQVIVSRLVGELYAYQRAHSVGVVLTSPADISWVFDVLVQPDIFVASADQVRTLDWARISDLLLVVEVLSPSSTRADRVIKRRQYQKVGVPCYWVVDGEEGHIEVWTPHDDFPHFERERIVWHPAGVPEPFSMTLSELFRPV